MKLRLILLVLSLLAFLSASVGGILYYASLKEAAIIREERQAITRSEMIRKNIKSFLSEPIKPVRTLAGMDELIGLCREESDYTQETAYKILTHFKNTLDADVCYLINENGITIASSNRYDHDSFMWQDFSFRPYFTESVKGKPFAYLALGTTSGKRGAYYSHPVIVKGDSGIESTCVAVIKVSVGLIEKALDLEPEETALVVSPDGIIFVSSRKDWLYRSISQLTRKKQEEIKDIKQFGEGPWNWVGLTISGRRAKDLAGNIYLITHTEMDNYPGWVIYYLKSYSAITESISGPLFRITKQIVFIVCIFVGLSVFFLYKKASYEIIRRKNAEKALRLAKEELSSYSKKLEKQVRKRTEEITSILTYTPDLVYIRDLEGRYLMINPRYEKLFGLSNSDVRGKMAHEIVPKIFADNFMESDRKVMNAKGPIQVEVQLPHADGLHDYLSVKFPIYDEFGNISGVGGIARDISELKKAQKQLKRLSASIIENQENERRAISRELHDEVGQILTALRMDAVWLMKRLKDVDENAADRAVAMCDLIDKSIEDIRSIAIRLRPGVLDDLGLVDALEWFTSDFERRTGIACVYEHKDIPKINNAVATAAYRIAQEALTNVARHADARRVEVLFKRMDSKLILTVTDDGCGFDPESISEAEGLGVAGMQERAALISAHLEVLSSSSGGAKVQLTIPLS